MFFIFILIVTSVFTVPVFAQEETSEQSQEEPTLEELTLAEYLDMVQANHPYFNTEQLSADIEQKQAKSLLGAKDWHLSVVPTYSYLGKSSVPEVGAEQLHRAGLEAGIDRSLWSTGGRLGFAWTSGYTRQDKDFGVSNLYRNGVSATFVIQSEDNEESAWLTYAGNVYFYHTLILQYLGILDEILVIE